MFSHLPALVGPLDGGHDDTLGLPQPVRNTHHFLLCLSPALGAGATPRGRPGREHGTEAPAQRHPPGGTACSQAPARKTVGVLSLHLGWAGAQA